MDQWANVSSWGGGGGRDECGDACGTSEGNDVGT